MRAAERPFNERRLEELFAQAASLLSMSSEVDLSSGRHASKTIQVQLDRPVSRPQSTSSEPQALPAPVPAPRT